MHPARTDLHFLSSVIQEIYGVQKLADFPDRIIEILARAVPADISAWNEVDHASNRIDIRHNFKPAEFVTIFEPALAACVWKHPVNHCRVQLL